MILIIIVTTIIVTFIPIKIVFITIIAIVKTLSIDGLAAQVENHDLDHHHDHHHHHIHPHHQSKTAVERLYNIKGRQPTKPIAICVGEVEDVQK